VKNLFEHVRINWVTITPIYFYQSGFYFIIIVSIFASSEKNRLYDCDAVIAYQPLVLVIKCMGVFDTPVYCILVIYSCT
jgi:hypothetical protein